MRKLIKLVADIKQARSSGGQGGELGRCEGDGGPGGGASPGPRVPHQGFVMAVLPAVFRLPAVTAEILEADQVSERGNIREMRDHNPVQRITRTGRSKDPALTGSLNTEHLPGRDQPGLSC